MFLDTIRVMYFLLINKPDVIFVDNDNFVKLIANILLLKDFDKIIKIVIIGEDKLPSVKLNSLESILNYNFDKAEIDEFSCEKNDLMEIAIMTFCSRAMFYSGRAKVPYVAFISPSNQQTPVMVSDTVGLWYGSLYWNHGPLLTVRAILSYVTVIKSRVFSEENLYKTIEKYKVTWVFLSETFNQLFKTNDVSFSKYNISSLKEFLFDDWEVEIFVLKKFISSLPNVSIIRVYGTAETGVIAYQTDNFSRRFKGRVTKNVQLLFVAKKNYPNIHPKLKFIYCKTPHISNTHVSTESAVHLWYSIGDVGFHIKDEIYVIDHYRHFYTYKNKPVRFLRSEIALRLHPAVSDVVVITVPNDDHLVAYINKISGKKVTKEQLKRILQKLPELHQLFPIDDFRFITHDFPRLPNGKIDRTRIHMLN
ncbi:4-coumarate--CoA ligase-like 7 [Pogonomyrmex barbatus]|uniref:4-coumarate--CoA ligase-like 7 n=1 Tax=Pogonomyrmex barbatus TaxID=144034 RepID=A0A6I9WX07_9HYME|nr:4-coumarate--CoA ligase-like 7 [Pogonomyrmex barbatus]